MLPLKKGDSAVTGATQTAPDCGDGPKVGEVHLDGACAALDRAWAAVALYDQGHAARARALAECVRGLREAGMPRLVLRVDARGWACAAHTPGASTGGDLARLLHALDVVAMDISPAIDERRLELMLEMLARARAEAWRGAALEGEVRAVVGDAASLTPVRTGRLTFVEGDATPGVSAGGEGVRAVSWAELADVLLKSGEGQGEQGDAIGERLTSMLAGATTHGSVPREMAQVGRLLAELPHEQQEIASARIAKWMGTLPAATREALLAMNDETTPGIGKLLHALAGRLPIEHILSALEQSTSSAPRSNARHNLLLFSKLSALAMDKSVDLQKRVLDVMSRLGTSGSSPISGEGEGVSALSAIGRLMEPNQADDFTPSDYRDRLQSLSQEMLRSAAASKDPDELSHERLRVRVGEIVSYILEHQAGNAPSRGLLEHLARAILPTLQDQRLDAFAEAACAGLKWTEAGSSPDELRTSAQGLLEKLLDPAVFHAAISVAGRQPSEHDRFLKLLDALGERALDRVIESLPEIRGSIHASRGEWIDVLERWVAGRARLWTVEEIVRLAKGPSLSDRAMLALMRRLPVATQARAIDEMATMKDDATRRRAYTLWEDLCPRWTGAQIRHAILDRDPQIARMGQARLARDATTSELCGMLRSLAMSVSEEEARLAQAVARVLERSPQDECVRKALKMWRYSPVRLRAGLLRKGAKGAAA